MRATKFEVSSLEEPKREIKVKSWRERQVAIIKPVSHYLFSLPVGP